MDWSKWFSGRFFVICSLISVGVVSAAIMISRETLPLPRVVSDGVRSTSVLKRLVYTPKNRSKNVAATGVPKALAKAVVRRIERHEKSFRHRKVNPLMSRGLMKDGIRTEEAFKFCPQEPGRVDPLYAVAPMLMEIEGLAARPLTLNELSTGIKPTHVGLIDDIETIYQQIEWVNFGGYTDKPCISMSYILLNRHAEIVEQTFEDDNGRSGRPKSCKALLANNDGLRKKLIDYLANFHYIAELAQNETSHICD